MAQLLKIPKRFRGRTHSRLTLPWVERFTVLAAIKQRLSLAQRFLAGQHDHVAVEDLIHECSVCLLLSVCCQRGRVDPAARRTRRAGMMVCGRGLSNGRPLLWRMPSASCCAIDLNQSASRSLEIFKEPNSSTPDLNRDRPNGGPESARKRGTTKGRRPRRHSQIGSRNGPGLMQRKRHALEAREAGPIGRPRGGRSHPPLQPLWSGI